ncbi:hypothetical protein BANRA_04383 [Escherichia coli]|nr:hypothetical protein BANRA_04383 [Escherichia coli]
MKIYIFSFILLCGCSPVDIEPARQEVNIFRGLYQTGNTVIYIKSLQVIFRLPHLKKIYRHNERSKRKRSWDL